MSFTRRILRNKHAVWALTIGVAVFGYLAYERLPVQLFPDTAPPLVNVITVFPGAAAGDVAQDLSRPLEEEFSSIEGVDEVSSSSQDNLSVVSVEFHYSREVDLAAVDVQNAIARIRGKLPRGIQEPQVLKFSTNDRPIATFGVRSPDLAEARKLAEDEFAPRFQQIEGVAAVDVFGGSVPAVLVEVDKEALERSHLPLGVLLDRLQSSNLNAPAGRIRSDHAQVMFTVENRAMSVEDIGRIPIPTPDGTRFLLSDLAEVHRGALDDDARFRIDGRQAIAIQLFKTTEANTVEVVEQAQQLAKQLGAEHTDIEIVPGEESATFTQTSVDNLLRNVLEAIFLAAVLIFFFLRQWRVSALVAVSMPLSFALTFSLMLLLGIEFNLITLSAVILSVGIVVDDSVVILENIARRRDEDGLSPEDSAAEGPEEVRGAVLGGVLTNIVVLVPLLFLPGFTGKTFGPLALTMILALGSSILVALVLIPVMSLHTRAGGRGDRLAWWISAPFSWLMDKIRQAYLYLVRVGLRHRAVVFLLVMALFAGGLFGLRALGMDVLPKMDGGSFFVSFETPSGSSLDETERVSKDIEDILGAEPEVVLIQTQMGFEQGMRSLSQFGVQGPTQGMVTVTLTDRTDRETSIWQIEGATRAAIDKVPGIRTATVRELGNTAKATTSAPLVVRLSGDDPLVLDKLAGRVQELIVPIEGVVAPMRTWRLDQKRTRFIVDDLKASQIGLDPADVAQAIMLGSQGVEAGAYYGDKGTPLPIHVRYEAQDRREQNDILDFSVFASKANESIPLREIATAQTTAAQGLVTRKNLAPTLEVSAFIEGRPLSEVLSDVEGTLASLNLPAGYRVDLAGEREDLDESRSHVGLALAISVLGVYLLLVGQFRSFLHPITILIAVPLSLAGVAAALWLAGKPVPLPVLIGLILLVGTVVKNSIILVDFFEQRRAQGLPLSDALVEAVRVRFRPIMMTALATIVGMIPLAAEWALGAERFSPLAIAVIGGFVTATFLTMVVVPIFYSILEDAKSWVGKMISRAKPISAAAGTGILVVLLAASANAEPVVRLSLEEAVERGIEHSHLIGQRQDQVDAAAATYKQSVGRFLPRLSLTGRYSRVSHVEPGTISLPGLPGVEQPETIQLGEAVDNQFSLRLYLEQPLFTGFALTGGLSAAEHAERLAGASLALSRVEVSLRIQDTYFKLHSNRALREVMLDSVRSLETLRRQVGALVGAGRATDLDLAMTDTRLARARADLARANQAVEQSRILLASQLGLPLTAEIELTTTLSDWKPPDLPSLDESTSRALEDRNEIVAARNRAGIENARVDIAAAKLWPKLSLRAGYHYDRPNQRYFPIEDRFHGSWDVSLVLGWTLWDWGVTYHQIESVRAGASAAKRRLGQVNDNVRVDVATQFNRYRQQLERLAATRRAVASAERAHAVTQAMFTAGRKTAYDLLEAESEMTRTRAFLVGSLSEARLAWAHYKRATGEGSP